MYEDEEPMDPIDEDETDIGVPAMPGGRVGEFIRDVAPGALKPNILIAGLVVMVVGLGVMIFAATWILLAPISAAWIGGAGLVVYIHGASWIVSGEFGFLTSTFLEFDGERWVCFLLMTLIPSGAAVMLTVSGIMGAEAANMAEMEDLFVHFEESGIMVELEGDRGYGGMHDVLGQVVVCATDKGACTVYIFKFDLEEEGHREELEKIRKRRKVEVSRQAPGLTQPAWVNGPYMMFPALGSDFDRSIANAFMKFDTSGGAEGS